MNDSKNSQLSDSAKPVVLISGGSRGLGLALVDLFLEKGWCVATFSRSETPEIANRIEQFGDERLTWVAADSSNDDDLKSVVRSTTKKWSKIDCLINNAGTGKDGLLALLRTDDIDQLLNLNLRSAVLLTQLCVKAMIRKGAGSIVNISSVNSVRGHSGVSVYSATKAAMDGLTRSLARELGILKVK